MEDSAKLAKINLRLKTITAEKLKAFLSEEEVKADPFDQFLLWFNLAIDTANSDPSAMILATVDEKNYPDTRMVLLKELEYQKFIFYSSYSSKKAKDLEKNNVAALNFYWPELFFQVRIRGKVEKQDRDRNEKYFASRPRGSQLSAQAWTQSSVLTSEEELDQRIQNIEQKYANQEIPCPEDWGGYVLTPFEYEFFQRRQWRRHERLFYSLSGNTWKMVRLAP